MGSRLAVCRPAVMTLKADALKQRMKPFALDVVHKTKKGSGVFFRKTKKDSRPLFFIRPNAPASG
jgi:hypothetical protein